jgi:hypothetical protein
MRIKIPGSSAKDWSGSTGSKRIASSTTAANGGDATGHGKEIERRYCY